jgi:hypothetical protein
MDYATTAEMRDGLDCQGPTTALSVTHSGSRTEIHELSLIAGIQCSANVQRTVDGRATQVQQLWRLVSPLYEGVLISIWPYKEKKNKLRD